MRKPGNPIAAMIVLFSNASITLSSIWVIPASEPSTYQEMLAVMVPVPSAVKLQLNEDNVVMFVAGSITGPAANEGSAITDGSRTKDNKMTNKPKMLLQLTKLIPATILQHYIKRFHL